VNMSKSMSYSTLFAAAKMSPWSRSWIDRALDGESDSMRRKVLVATVAEYLQLDTEKSLTATPPGGPYYHPNLEKEPPFYKDQHGVYRPRFGRP
jgi:hypothetical protein